MIRRSIVICTLSMVLLVSAVTQASILSPAITKLFPATIAPVSGGMGIYGKLRGIVNGGTITPIIPLVIPGSGLAAIAAAVLTIAGPLCFDYVYDRANAWFNDMGINRDLMRTSLERVPANGGNPADYEGIINISGFNAPVIGYGIYADATAAYDAANAWRNANCTGTGGHRATSYLGAYAYYFYQNCQGRPPEVAMFFYPPGAWVLREKQTQLTPAQVGALMGAGINTNPNAQLAAAAALSAAAAALENPASELGSRADLMKQIMDALLAGASAQTLADAEAGSPPRTIDDVLEDEDKKTMPVDITNAVIAALQAQGLSAAQIAAAMASIIAALPQPAEGQSLTPAQVADAVAAGLLAQGITITNIGTTVQHAVADAMAAELPVPVPPDPLIPLPDKLSLTAVLTSFIDAVKNLPMLNTLRGLTINTSGTSQACINLPAQLGGSHCIDGSSYQGPLNMIGSLLLGLTTLMSFIGIFRG